jgi:hypothetical protein
MVEHPINPAFDPDELGEALAALPIARIHSTHGEGFRYALGLDPDEPRADLEVYPDARLIRYTSEGLQVTFRSRELHAQYTDEGVIFDAITLTEQRTMTVSPTGEILLVGLDIPRLTKSANAPEFPAPTPQPHDRSSQTEENSQPRIVLVGRAGRDPHVATTRGGTIIAKFPLGVHEEDETLWHTVVAFNGLASEVADTVKRGEEYKVVGYQHERDDHGRPVKEIYAATIRPPTRKQQPKE